jgi:3-oxoacyl-[acyl-carrier-protein] synthase II
MTDTALTDAQRVVVTGLGATTPLGGDVASTWSGLLAGTSGVKVLTEDWVDMLPVHIAAPVAVEPVEVLTVPQTKRMDRSGQFALIAAREAWADAGEPDVEPERKGVVIASGIGGVTTLLAAYDTLKERGARRVLPMTVPMLMPNGPAAVVGLELTARAGVHTPVSACSSGAEAIAYAVDMIRSGRADVVAAGGTEAAIHALPLAGFAAMQALSTRNDEPERASRPYDKGRDGFVLGEGAGVPRSMPRSPARASPPTPTTWPSPTRSVPARRARCSRQSARPGRSPPTWCTSTRTPRPPRWATWPRWRRSGARSATPPTGPA